MTDSDPENSYEIPGILNPIPPGTFGSPVLGAEIDYFLSRTKYRVSIFSGYALLGLIWAGLVFFAFRLRSDSFAQELCVVLSAGVATFLGTPIILKLGSKWRDVTIPIFLALSVGCCSLASGLETPLRSILLEASVSLILILALEMLFHVYLKAANQSLSAAEAAFKENKAEFRRAVDEWNENHPYGPHVDEPEE